MKTPQQPERRRDPLEVAAYELGLAEALQADNVHTRRRTKRAIQVVDGRLYYVEETIEEIHIERY